MHRLIKGKGKIELLHQIFVKNNLIIEINRLIMDFKKLILLKNKMIYIIIR